jgi:hypothetical protein
MTTRMEKVAEDIALAALRKATLTTKPPLQLETLKEAFQARWPVAESNRPMNNAMRAAAQVVSSCTDEEGQSWQSTVSQAWQPAVWEAVEEYFKIARHSFRKGEYLQGAETLTDAVRATFGHIAATRNWPHGTQDDLYSIAAALGSRTGWPGNLEEFDKALDNCSKEGKRLGSALGASTGLPRSITFGSYVDAPGSAEEDGLSFAETVIELANRLAGEEPARA